MKQYYYAIQNGLQFNLRHVEDSHDRHVAYVTHVETDDIKTMVSQMNEACRFHLPEGVSAIKKAS